MRFPAILKTSDLHRCQVLHSPHQKKSYDISSTVNKKSKRLDGQNHHHLDCRLQGTCYGSTETCTFPYEPRKMVIVLRGETRSSIGLPQRGQKQFLHLYQEQQGLKSEIESQRKQQARERDFSLLIRTSSCHYYLRAIISSVLPISTQETLV